MMMTPNWWKALTLCDDFFYMFNMTSSSAWVIPLYLIMSKALCECRPIPAASHNSPASWLAEWEERLNMHNWMTHSGQFTDSIQSLKEPMGGKSPPSQIKAGYLKADFSGNKWHSTKVKCSNNLALSLWGLSHIHILEGLQSWSL